MKLRFSTGYSIDLRRSIAAATGVVTFVAAIWVTHEASMRGIVLWRDVSYGLQYSILVVGPAAAAGAAWVAGRERRARTRELLRSLPSTAWKRRRPSLLAFVTLVGVGYAAAMVSLFVQGLFQATWGTPDMSLLAPAWAALIACAVTGFVIGSALPFAATAPFVGVALFVAIAVPAYKESSSIHFLTPISLAEVSPFYGIRATVGLLQTSWFLSLAVAGLVGCWAFGTHGLWRWRIAANAAALSSVVISAALLLRTSPSSAGSDFPAVPRCVSSSTIQVCLHPAYAALLPRFALVANDVTEAAASAGIPVTRVIQDTRYRAYVAADGSVHTSLGFVNSRYDDPYSAGVLAHALVTNGCSGRESVMNAQEAAAAWILQLAGFTNVYAPGPAVTTVVRHLQRLPGTEAESWMATHIAGIRACNVTLRDFPH